MLVGISFEMDYNLQVVSRNTYNALDLLSDIGGIESILVTILNILIRFWNSNHLDLHMIKKLYQLPFDMKLKEAAKNNRR